MSHIPSTAMPHAQAHGDTIDEQQSQPDKRQSETETAAATPERAGEVGERGGINDSVKLGALDRRPDGEDGRPAALVAAMVLGGLAALGGVVAAVLPLIDRKPKKKGKKRKA